jgi:hypothetical protein
VLLAFAIVWPKPDQAAETLHDRRDDSIVRECALDSSRAGWRSLSPAAQPDRVGGEARLELTPAPDSTYTVGRPGMIVDADQPGKSQKRLTGSSDTQQARSHRPGLQRLPPSPKMPTKSPLNLRAARTSAGKAGSLIPIRWRKNAAQVTALIPATRALGSRPHLTQIILLGASHRADHRGFSGRAERRECALLRDRALITRREQEWQAFE